MSRKIKSKNLFIKGDVIIYKSPHTALHLFGDIMFSGNMSADMRRFKKYLSSTLKKPINDNEIHIREVIIEDNNFPLPKYEVVFSYKYK